jgi:hypothetical protein|tara:strand:- start:1861 stop:2001 length:141 start_codon:yes stop_codon:yes gene_type:complete
MKLIIQPIMGVHVGFELAEAQVEEEIINYLLIDIFIIRFQFAWYKI